MGQAGCCFQKAEATRPAGQSPRKAHHVRGSLCLHLSLEEWLLARQLGVLLWPAATPLDNTQPTQLQMTSACF